MRVWKLAVSFNLIHDFLFEVIIAMHCAKFEVTQSRFMYMYDMYDMWLAVFNSREREYIFLPMKVACI